MKTTINLSDRTMRQRIKSVMHYRKRDYFVGEMVRNKIYYRLKKIHNEKSSPLTDVQFIFLINSTHGDDLAWIYKKLKSYIEQMLKDDICPTCRQNKHQTIDVSLLGRLEGFAELFAEYQKYFGSIGDTMRSADAREQKEFAERLIKELS